MEKLAVYGTLFNDNLPKATVKGRIYDFGPFPGIQLDNNGYNIEVGIINVEDFISLDYYEGVPNLYTRKQITINNEKIHIYIPTESLMKDQKVEILPDEPKKYTTITFQK